MFDFLSEKFSSLVSSMGNSQRLTEKNLEDVLAQVQTALLDADVPYEVTRAFIQEVKESCLGKKLFASLKPSELFTKIVHEKLLSFLGGASIDATFAFQIPSVLMVMGLQGAGKTTTIGKLAHHIVSQAAKRGKLRRILVGSVDFYRPAAVEQLEIVAQAAGVDFYRSDKSSVVDAASDIIAYGRRGQYEIIILDTAGRLHIDTQLLNELLEIDKAVAPKYKILVTDAMMGQESLAVAKAFESAVGFDAGILTKVDSQTRAGAAFAFRYSIRKPLLFVGTGEKKEDFDLFRPERIAQRILGMGDITTLIEKAEEKIKKSDQEALYASMMKGKMTLLDFSQQMNAVSKMGPLRDLLKYIPGAAAGMNVSAENIAKGELEMKRSRAIISSMTHKEKISYKILDASRKERIAKGAGVTVLDVDSLISRFEQSQQFVKLFKKMGRF